MTRACVLAGALLVGACAPAPQSESVVHASAAPEAKAALPMFTEITLPAGTPIAMVLETAVASDSSAVEDKVRAKLSKPIVIDGTTAVPAGADVTGSVVAVERAGRVKGRASLAIRFHEMTAWETAYELDTRRIARQAAATKGEDATKIGLGAGAGAVIGAVAGGKKGAAIGGAIGGGAGAGVVMATRGEEVRLGKGAALETTLAAPVAVRVPR
jgi:hypothetical protein